MATNKNKYDYSFPDSDPGTQLATDGNLVFTLKTFEGIRTLDIRKYYRKRGSKEFLPTTKGITVTKKTYRTICNILEKNEKEIEDWFMQDDEIEKNVSRQQESLKNAKVTPQKACHQEDSWRSPTFFEAESRGGKNIITYNSEHQFFKQFSATIREISKTNPEAASRLQELIDDLFSAFHQSESLFEQTPVISPNALLETLAFNWGMILNNALKK